MAAPLPLVAAGAALATSGLLVLYPSTEETRVALALPPDVTSQQVETLLGTIAGLPRQAQVITEVEGAAGRLAFALEAHQRLVAALRAGLQGMAPGVRLSESDDDELPAPSLRAWIGWRGSYVLLRDDQRELAVANLLGVLRAAKGGERLRLRVRLRPVVRPKAPAHRREATPGLLERIIAPLAPVPSDQSAANSPAVRRPAAERSNRAAGLGHQSPARPSPADASGSGAQSPLRCPRPLFGSISPLGTARPGHHAGAAGVGGLARLAAGWPRRPRAGLCALTATLAG